MDSEATARFLADVDNYPQMWDWLEAKAILADKQGVPILLAMHCTLSCGLVSQRDVVFESPGLTMVKEVSPFSQLRDLLADLSTGSINLAGRNVKVEGFSQFAVNSWSGGGQGWVDISHPYVLLHADGRAVRELVNEDEIAKRLLAYGYRDIFSLSQEKLGFQVGGAYSSQIRIIAPIFLEANASFANGKIVLVLRCSQSIRKYDLSASCEVVEGRSGKRKTSRYSLDLSDAIRSEEGTGFLLTKELGLPPEAESAMIWVFHSTRSEPLYALRVAKAATLQSSPVWGALSLVLTRQSGGQMLDTPRILRDSLGLANHNQVRDAGRLEVAIHALLGCAGFVCIFTGREWGIQGIDTLAFPPGMGKVFAISVTTTNNISEKTRTMLPVINELKRQLSDLSISPVIVAPVEPENVLSSDASDAKHHGVQLILLPQLVELLDAVMNMAQDRFAEKVDALFASSDKPSMR